MIMCCFIINNSNFKLIIDQLVDRFIFRYESARIKYIALYIIYTFFFQTNGSTETKTDVDASPELLEKIKNQIEVITNCSFEKAFPCFYLLGS